MRLYSPGLQLETAAAPMNPASLEAIQSRPPTEAARPQAQIPSQATAPTQPGEHQELEWDKGDPTVFRSTLLEYGRAIMRSTMSDIENPQAHQEDIITTKNQVVALYMAMVHGTRHLSSALTTVSEEVSELGYTLDHLRTANATLEEDRASRIQDLELEVDLLKEDQQKDIEGLLREKENYVNMCEEGERIINVLEAEVTSLKQDKKRKIDKMEEMWENVERSMEP